MTRFKIIYADGSTFTMKAADRNEALKWAKEARPGFPVKSIEPVSLVAFDDLTRLIQAL